MKKILLILAVTFIAMSCIKVKTTTTEVKKVSEERQLKGFKSIAIDGSPDVHYKQDSVWSVTVFASEEIMPYVRTEVKDGQLKVFLKRGHPISKEYTVKIGDKTIINGSGDVDVMVSSPDLIGITLQGSGNFVAQGKIDTDKLDIRLRGSGEIKNLDVICDTITTELVGSGDISNMKVDAFSSDVTLIGSGDIKMWQQNVRNSMILLKGSGDIFINHNNCGNVFSDLQGSGDIRLTGTVKSLNNKRLGSGDYELSGLKVLEK